MLNGRIYRAALLPLLFALAIAGFSLGDRPAPLGTNLAPEAFDGAHADALLQSLAARYPDRRPGSPGDQALAAYIAGTLRGLGGTASGGFAVTTHSVQAQTIDGERTLTTVVAQRPGTTGARPLAIIAHRDAASVGASGELSATATLLELARVFAASETRRTIILVSTSGGSGGNAGAADFAAHDVPQLGGSIDAAIVLGDLAVATRRPSVATFSGAPGFAPELLQRTVAQAIAQQAGVAPAAPKLLDQLAQLTFPLAAGEQGPLLAHGVPTVLVQAGGELAPPADAPLAPARLEGMGRAVLSALYALDAGPEVTSAAGASATALPIQRKLLPEWAVRLIVATLLLGPLLVAGDGLARLRRRRSSPPVGSGGFRPPQLHSMQSNDGRSSAARALGRWLLWVPACGLPFLVCALFAILLGSIGAIPAPYPPVTPAALPFDGSALEAVLAVALVFVLAWLAWPALLRRLGLPLRPHSDAAGLAVVLVLGVLAVVVWAIDPFTALLLVPALHLWLLLAVPREPTARWQGAARLALVALGVAPLALLIAFDAQRLGLGLGGVAHAAVLLLAGGRVGLVGAVLWSIALGCAAAASLVALAPVDGPRTRPNGGPGDLGEELDSPSIRGRWTGAKSNYAGPGSLGGTESALRR